MRCPSLQALTDYLRGLGVGTERAQIQTHLATGCATCQQNQQWLLEIKRIAPLDDSFEFPAAITAHIISWMPQKPARTPLRTLIAQLLFDSFAPQPLVEVREAIVPDAKSNTFAARQLLYQVEGFDVDLRIEKTDDSNSYEVIGQVLQQTATATDSPGLPVQLWSEGKQLLSISTDDEGVFRFTDLEPGTYQARILLSDNVIEIPEIVLEEN